MRGGQATERGRVLERALSDARLAIHAALTGIMAWLAIMLALPTDTFSTSATFAVMAQLGEETVWAMVFWLVANVGLIGLFTPSRGLRFVSVLIVATMHGVVALCFVMANPATTGTGTYAIIAMLGYYLGWRRAHEGV